MPQPKIRASDIIGLYFTRGLYRNIVEDFHRNREQYPVAMRIDVQYRGQIAVCSGLRGAIIALGYPYKVYARGPFVYLCRGPAALRPYSPDSDRGRYTP